VQFIDEEAIYPCMEETALKWRKKFLMVGARFDWFCIEVRHYNCFNSLENDESFICWDSRKESVWIRRPPAFAIRNHPLLRPRVDTFQDFLPRTSRNGITITGIRVYESVQRLGYFASMISSGHSMTKKNQVFPIYDWRDCDVWRYLYENNVEIPEIYHFLWQSGHRKQQLRVAQFFSIDSARSLVKMNEYYPDLLERIIRREPNAYIAALYWDSEMFGRSSNKRRELEEGVTVEKDYKAELIKLFNNMDVYFTTPRKKKVAEKYRKLFMNTSTFTKEKDYKDLYEALIKGDPKLRAYRAVFQNIYVRYINEAKKGQEATPKA
jgi:predicted phosphoadenosine phosphosulfate sulfurtransferase